MQRIAGKCMADPVLSSVECGVVDKQEGCVREKVQERMQISSTACRQLMRREVHCFPVPFCISHCAVHDQLHVICTRRLSEPGAALATASNGGLGPRERNDAAGAAVSAGSGELNIDAQAAALGLRTASDACSLWGITGLPVVEQRGSDSRRRVARLLHDIMGAGDPPFP